MTLSQNENLVVIDDDPMIGQVIGQITGKPVHSLTNIADIHRWSADEEPSALFIDVHLDVNVNGIDLIEGLRQKWPFVPIIVVTSDSDDQIIGKALALGANDYIRKPIHRGELIARLQARQLEMREKRHEETFTIGKTIFQSRDRSLSCGEQTHFLSPTAGELLKFLIETDGKLVQKDLIKGRLWPNTKVTDNNLDKKISEIRSALISIDSDMTVKSTYGKGIQLATVGSKAG